MAHPVSPPPLARRVFVVGLGTTKFEKPGSRDWDYPDMIGESVNKALKDAQLQYSDIQSAAVGYLYGASCCGQRGLYDIGLTGIPIFNVNNACASGSSAMLLMKTAIEAGAVECALAVGFEKMAKGSLEAMGMLTDRAQPVEKHVNVMSETYGLEAAPMTAQMFGMAGLEHMEKYGTKREHFAKIAYKNHKHSVNNPDAQFQKEYSMQEIMSAKKIYRDVIGMLECSPTSDGSAAVIMCSELFLRDHPHLQSQAVHILGAQLGTDVKGAFTEKSNIKMIGFDLIRGLSQKLYKQTGLGPEDCQVIELHDCFATNELISYEAMGLCPIGKGGDIVDRNDNTYGGRWVINPSGGLEAKGHPIGATGVSQCVELCKHLRGIAGKRQVPNCRVALQHNIGIGGAGFMAMYKLAFPTYPGTNASVAPAVKSAGDSDFLSDAMFAEVTERAKTDGAHLAKTVNSSFRFNITNAAGKSKSWLVNAKKQPVFVGQSDEKAECELTTTEDVLMQIQAGKLKPDEAFMQGKIKIKGNLMKAMKLKDVLNFQQKAKL